MEISTLNKVINLFLVGLFMLSLIFFFNFTVIIGWLKSQEPDTIQKHISPPLAIFGGTLIMLSCSLFLGLFLDSVISFLRSLKPRWKCFGKNGWIICFLLCKSQVERTEKLRELCNRAYRVSGKYDLDTDDDRDHTFAVALFFHTAKTENMEWLIQHYSIYLLAANYSLLLFIALGMAVFSSHGWGFKLIFFVIDVSAIYLLLRAAINKYFYAHAVVYRHVCVVLGEQRGENMERKNN